MTDARVEIPPNRPRHVWIILPRPILEPPTWPNHPWEHYFLGQLRVLCSDERTVIEILPTLGGASLYWRSIVVLLSFERAMKLYDMIDAINPGNSFDLTVDDQERIERMILEDVQAMEQ